jgi:hypothetical protein
MAPKPKTSAEAAAHFQAFLCAGIADLCRLVQLPNLHEFCAESRPKKRAATESLIPASPAVAQLSLYLLLVTRGLQPKHADVYPHRERLRDLLHRVYRKAIKSWDDGDLKDVQGLHPGVRTLAKFASRNIAGFEQAGGSLDEFGVTSVQKSLAILTEKLAMTFAHEIAKRPAKVPAELAGASLVASATSPGVIEKIGDGHTVQGLMRLGVRAGLAEASSSKTGTRTAGLDELRKFLKRAHKVLER